LLAVAHWVGIEVGCTGRGQRLFAGGCLAKSTRDMLELKADSSEVGDFRCLSFMKRDKSFHLYNNQLRNGGLWLAWTNYRRPAGILMVIFIAVVC
jgi:hypothetical protein